MASQRFIHAAVLSALVSIGSAAAETGDFAAWNCAETIVTGTAGPDQERGTAEIFHIVAMKMSGLDIARDRDHFNRLPSAPPPIVRREIIDRMAHLPVRDEQGTRERPHVLRLCFDADAMAETLASGGMPLWPEDRPMVRVALAVAMPAVRYVVRKDGPEGYGQRLALVESAARRGLPIELPAHETGALGYDQIASVTAGGKSAVAISPLLYGLLTFDEAGASWNGVWRLDQGEPFDGSGLSFDEAIRAGIGGAVESLRPPPVDR